VAEIKRLPSVGFPDPSGSLLIMRTNMTPSLPVVHLELHTSDMPGATTLCAQLCGWRAQPTRTASGCYVALELGGELGGGIVECGTTRAVWVPYVAVSQIDTATDLARQLGAAVLLEPREGPAGWRSVITTPAAGEIALWQQKGWQS
jgi:predicted enzyme related to lactoylglutathione lyase